MTSDQIRRFQVTLFDTINDPEWETLGPEASEQYTLFRIRIEKAENLKDFAEICRDLAWDWQAFCDYCEQHQIQLFADGITRKLTQQFCT